MAWIESHASLARHPKTLRLARRLDVPIPTAIGHLHLLWWWALEYAQDGDLSRYEAAEIATACLWEGDPQRLVDALIGRFGWLTSDPREGQEAGFLVRGDDGGLRIADFEEFAGKYLRRRELNATWRRARRVVLPSVLERDGLVCQICGAPVDPRELSLDHIYPKSKGGSHDAANLRVAHRRCNAKKGARA